MKPWQSFTSSVLGRVSWLGRRLQDLHLARVFQLDASVEAVMGAWGFTEVTKRSSGGMCRLTKKD